MSSVLPCKTKEERELKREIAIINGKEQDSYFELIEDVSTLYLLSQEELACFTSKQSPKWCKAAVYKFINVSPHEKSTKDSRVHQLSKMLDIGTVNTLEICKNFILAALPKFRAGLKSLLYQRVTMLQTSKKYGYLDLLGLFTALYLKAEAEKQMRSSQVRVALSATARTKNMAANPYQDFLNQEDIKKFTNPDHRWYLSALSQTLTDSDVLCNQGSLASRNIETCKSKKQSNFDGKIKC